MAKVPVIDIRPHDLEIVREILRRHVPNHEVLAFGSRVRWTARQYSDLDLAIRSDEAIPTDIIYAIKNELSESNLPMMVDVLDMASVSEKFRGIIEEEYAVVQEKIAYGNWKEVRLADVADISTGKSNRVDATEDGEYAFFDRSKDVRKSSRYLFDCEAVIVPGEGKEFIPRYFSGKFDLHQRAYAIANFRGVCGRFVYYAMGAQRKYFERVAVGSTVKSLRLKMFQDFPLRLPPLAEQKKIARILGALDDKIELNRRMNKTLEAMAQAIFKSWFVDFDPVHAKSKRRAPALPPALADLFPSQFQDSELGKIPRGWETGLLKDLSLKPQYGYTVSANKAPVGPKFLRITDINKTAWIDWASVPHCRVGDEDFQKYRVRKGDILIARMADPGHGVMIEEEVAAVFASYLIRFRPTNEKYSRFLQYWLRSSEYWEQARGATSRDNPRQP